MICDELDEETFLGQLDRIVVHIMKVEQVGGAERDGGVLVIYCEDGKSWSCAALI